MPLPFLLCAVSACSSVDQRGDVDTAPPIDCSFQACGGDLTGDWQLTSGCVEDPSVDSLQGCPDSVIALNARVSGSASFASDGTYVLSPTIGGTRTYRVPISCTPGLTCDDVGQSITASCSATAASCECSSEVESSGSRVTGSYTVDGSELTLHANGDEADASQTRFCVTGSSLALRTVDAAGKITLLIGTR